MTAILGDTVRFQRSPAHHKETGRVVAVIFCSDDIEVEDQDAQRLRLTGDQYEVTGSRQS